MPKVACPKCGGVMSFKAKRCAICWLRMETARIAALPVRVLKTKPVPVVDPEPVSSDQERWEAFRASIWPGWHR